MNKKQVEKRFEELVQQLRSLFAISNSAVEVPKETLDKIAAGLCIFCSEPLEDNPKKKHHRGCHENCYQKVRRKVKSGKYADEDAAVAAGLWGLEAKVGRKEMPRPNIGKKAHAIVDSKSFRRITQRKNETD